MKSIALSLLLAPALVLTSCTQYATISETRPVFRPLRAAVGTLVAAEQSIAKGMEQEKGQPQAALGELLTAAAVSVRELERNPRDTAARDNYNFAVARVF